MDEWLDDGRMYSSLKELDTTLLKFIKEREGRERGWGEEGERRERGGGEGGGRGEGERRGRGGRRGGDEGRGGGSAGWEERGRREREGHLPGRRAMPGTELLIRCDRNNNSAASATATLVLLSPSPTHTCPPLRTRALLSSSPYPPSLPPSLSFSPLGYGFAPSPSSYLLSPLSRAPSFSPFRPLSHTQRHKCLYVSG